MRDDLKGQCFRIVCRTLYDVRLKKRVQTQIERFHKVDYQQLWVIFGINLGPAALTKSSSQGKKAEEGIDRAQVVMVAALLLQTHFLHMPTMEINKGDAEDSDYEEEANIAMRKVDCVVHIRKLLDVNGEKLPLTISLLGFDNKHYLGIKVVVFNPTLIKELGFFFTVNQAYWELSQD